MQSTRSEPGPRAGRCRWWDSLGQAVTGEHQLRDKMVTPPLGCATVRVYLTLITSFQSLPSGLPHSTSGDFLLPLQRLLLTFFCLVFRSERLSNLSQATPCPLFYCYAFSLSPNDCPVSVPRALACWETCFFSLSISEKSTAGSHRVTTRWFHLVPSFVMDSASLLASPVR